MTVGRKLREARKTGYEFVVLVGKDCLDPKGPLVEVMHNLLCKFRYPV